MHKTIYDIWSEMKYMLEQEANGLSALRVVTDGTEKFRLVGKTEGVNHAVTKMEEYERQHPELFSIAE